MGSQENDNAANGAAPIDLDDDAAVDDAMRAAVSAALRDHKAAGDYVVAWQDGHVVRVAAPDINVPDDPA